MPGRTLKENRFPLARLCRSDRSHPGPRLLVTLLALASGLGTIQKRAVSIGGNMMPGEFDYHVGKRWLPMTKTRWTNRNDRRSLLLYLDPVDKRMKLPSIPDRVTPPCRGTSLAGPNLPGSTIQGSSCFCRSLVLPCSGGVSNHN